MHPVGTDELTRAECLALLATQRYGRVVYSERALPAIRPVACALVGSRVLLSPLDAPTGYELVARLDGQVVAFEVDGTGSAGDWTAGGWSVVVTGTARAVPPEGAPALPGVSSSSGVPAQASGPATAVWLDCADVRGHRLHALTR